MNSEYALAPPTVASQPISFGATDQGDGVTVQAADNFFGPRTEGAK